LLVAELVSGAFGRLTGAMQPDWDDV
jgi:hypothetical protein